MSEACHGVFVVIEFVRNSRRRQSKPGELDKVEFKTRHVSLTRRPQNRRQGTGGQSRCRFRAVARSIMRRAPSCAGPRHEAPGTSAEALSKNNFIRRKEMIVSTALPVSRNANEKSLLPRKASEHEMPRSRCVVQ